MVDYTERARFIVIDDASRPLAKIRSALDAMNKAAEALAKKGERSLADIAKSADGLKSNLDAAAKSMRAVAPSDDALARVRAMRREAEGVARAFARTAGPVAGSGGPPALASATQRTVQALQRQATASDAAATAQQRVGNAAGDVTAAMRNQASQASAAASEQRALATALRSARETIVAQAAAAVEAQQIAAPPAPANNPPKSATQRDAGPSAAVAVGGVPSTQRAGVRELAAQVLKDIAAVAARPGITKQESDAIQRATKNLGLAETARRRLETGGYQNEAHRLRLEQTVKTATDRANRAAADAAGLQAARVGAGRMIAQATFGGGSMPPATPPPPPPPHATPLRPAGGGGQPPPQPPPFPPAGGGGGQPPPGTTVTQAMRNMYPYMVAGAVYGTGQKIASSAKEGIVYSQNQRELLDVLGMDPEKKATIRRESDRLGGEYRQLSRAEFLELTRDAIVASKTPGDGVAIAEGMARNAANLALLYGNSEKGMEASRQFYRAADIEGATDSKDEALVFMEQLTRETLRSGKDINARSVAQSIANMGTAKFGMAPEMVGDIVALSDNVRGQTSAFIRQMHEQLTRFNVPDANRAAQVAAGLRRADGGGPVQEELFFRDKFEWTKSVVKPLVEKKLGRSLDSFVDPKTGKETSAERAKKAAAVDRVLSNSGLTPSAQKLMSEYLMNQDRIERQRRDRRDVNLDRAKNLPDSNLQQAGLALKRKWQDFADKYTEPMQPVAARAISALGDVLNYFAGRGKPDQQYINGKPVYGPTRAEAQPTTFGMMPGSAAVAGGVILGGGWLLKQSMESPDKAALTAAGLGLSGAAVALNGAAAALTGSAVAQKAGGLAAGAAGVVGSGVVGAAVKTVAGVAIGAALYDAVGIVDATLTPMVQGWAAKIRAMQDEADKKKPAQPEAEPPKAAGSFGDPGSGFVTPDQAEAAEKQVQAGAAQVEAANMQKDVEAQQAQQYDAMGNLSSSLSTLGPDLSGAIAPLVSVPGEMQAANESGASSILAALQEGASAVASAITAALGAGVAVNVTANGGTETGQMGTSGR